MRTRRKDGRHRGDPSRRPANPVEAECFDALTALGWKVTKRGYPDFFCWKGSEIMFVECKPTKHQPSKNQKRIMNVLRAHGIKCATFIPQS